jgi:hypothetical protein
MDPDSTSKGGEFTRGIKILYHFSLLPGLSNMSFLFPAEMKKILSGDPGGQTVKVFSLITINSVLFYLLAYITIFLVTRLMTAFSASAFNISSVIYYFDMDFLTNGHEWSRDAVTVVFSTGPVVSLVLGLAFIVLYGEMVELAGIAGVFMVWLIILCLVNFTGELITGAILNRGFGYAMMYWYIMDTGRVVLTLIFSLALILAGRELARFLLCSGNVYFNDLTGKVKLKFALCQFILPFMIAAVILQICELPHFSFCQCAVRCAPVLILLPLISCCPSVPDLYFDDDHRKPVLSKSLLVITLLALLVYRVVFGFGIRVA